MKSHISIPQWLSLDTDARRQFKAKFEIRASGSTDIIHDANSQTRVLSDGVMDKDLDASFSIEHMIEYLKEDLPWFREDLLEHLFKLTQDKFYGRDVEWYEREPGESSTEEVKSQGKGRGRKKSPTV